MRRNHLDALLAQLLVEGVAIVGSIADQVLGPGFDHVEVKTKLHQDRAQAVATPLINAINSRRLIRYFHANGPVLHAQHSSTLRRVGVLMKSVGGRSGGPAPDRDIARSLYNVLVFEACKILTYLSDLRSAGCTCSLDFLAR
jgi:hypothetical protein